MGWNYTASNHEICAFLGESGGHSTKKRVHRFFIPIFQLVFSIMWENIYVKFDKGLNLMVYYQMFFTKDLKGAFNEFNEAVNF